MGALLPEFQLAGKTVQSDIDPLRALSIFSMFLRVFSMASTRRGSIPVAGAGLPVVAPLWQCRRAIVHQLCTVRANAGIIPDVARLRLKQIGARLQKRAKGYEPDSR